MSKLKLDDLPENSELTDEQKQELVGGRKGKLDLNMTGSMP